MVTGVLKNPKFDPGQTVRFLGGEGCICHCCLDSGGWTYAVKMSMGPAPTMGRIGPETTVLLHESDLIA